MFGLIASISAEKVYQMDDHVFNWIGDILSVLALVATVATIFGGISLYRFRKRIQKVEEDQKNNNNKIAEALHTLQMMDEVANNKMENITLANVEIVINLLYDELSDLTVQNAQRKFPMVKANLDELVIIMPDHFNDSEIYIGYMNFVMNIFSLFNRKISLFDTWEQKNLLSSLNTLKENKVRISNIKDKITKESDKKIVEMNENISSVLREIEEKINVNNKSNSQKNEF